MHLQGSLVKRLRKIIGLWFFCLMGIYCIIDYFSPGAPAHATLQQFDKILFSNLAVVYAGIIFVGIKAEIHEYRRHLRSGNEWITYSMSQRYARKAVGHLGIIIAMVISAALFLEMGKGTPLWSLTILGILPIALMLWRHTDPIFVRSDWCLDDHFSGIGHAEVKDGVLILRAFDPENMPETKVNTKSTYFENLH
jgi:hypothetical protein